MDHWSTDLRGAAHYAEMDAREIAPERDDLPTPAEAEEDRRLIAAEERRGQFDGD